MKQSEAPVQKLKRLIGPFKSHKVPNETNRGTSPKIKAFDWSLQDQLKKLTNGLTAFTD